MYRYIVSTAAPLNPTKLVNTVGKSISKKLLGTLRKRKESNECIVDCTILYQIPKEVSHRYMLPKEVRDNVGEMDVQISVTTYSNKIRVNMVQLTPKQKTMGCKTFKVDTFNNVQQGMKAVMTFIGKCVEREYPEYEVLF